MKTKFYFILLISFFFAANLSQAFYWKKVENLPLEAKANYWLDVYFLESNPTYGWICGYNGMVLKTVNSGRTWTLHKIPGFPMLESIHFVDENIGYSSGPGGGFKSTNGGVNWFSILDSNKGNYWGTFFLDKDFGFVLGGGCVTDGVISRTTNGGITWQDTILAKNMATGFTDLIMFPNGEGYASSSGFIWTTLDSGDTWSILSSTGTRVWQEEITYVNGSILVPIAGNDCMGTFDVGGARMTTDKGASWQSFNSGSAMFGAFLNSKTTGWVCGYNASLYKTVDGGRTWIDKSCGIKDHLDDIWFINDNLGWTVGSGIYYTAPDTVKVDRDTMSFTQLCPGDILKDTMYVEVLSEEEYIVSAEIAVGQDNFKLLYPQYPTDANRCFLVPVIISYTAGDTDERKGLLEITTRNVYTNKTNDFDVILIGKAHEMTSAPNDTVLTINPAFCRTKNVGRIYWNSEAPGDTIVSYEKLDAINRINAETKVPVVLSPNYSSPFEFSAFALDTGWFESDYVFTVGPCKEDFKIKVRAYGVSPIINTPLEANMGLLCEGKIEILEDKIPITNTGNNNLIIESWELINPNSGFSVDGLVSGQSFPVRLAPGASDTLRVSFDRSFPVPAETELHLINNDSTRARGVQNPRIITLKATTSFTDVISVTKNLNFGIMCIGGEPVEREITLFNKGNLNATIREISFINGETQVSLEGDSEIKLIDTMKNTTFSVFFTPTSAGKVDDTLKIITDPCGDSLFIPLKAEVVRSILDLTDNLIEASAVINAPTEIVIDGIITSDRNVEINAYELNPPDDRITISITSPFPVNFANVDAEPLSFTVALSASEPLIYSGQICFSGEGFCEVSDCVDLRFESYDKQFSGEDLDLDVLKCESGTLSGAAIISNIGKVRGEIVNYYLSPDGEPFTLINPPALPISLDANEEKSFEVAFSPQADGVYETYLVYVSDLGKIDSLRISAEFILSNISVNRTEIIFEDFEYCSRDVGITTQIRNIGNVDHAVSIALAEPSGVYTLSPLGDLTLAPNETISVTVRLYPNLATEAGKYENTLLITSLECPQEFMLPISSEMIEPKLAVSPNPLDFGSRWIDEALTLDLTVNNDSDFQVSLDDIKIAGANSQFTYDLPLPRVIMPNSKLNIPVTFNASQEGDFTSPVEITYSSVCEYKDTVVFRGLVPEEQYLVDLWIDNYEVDAGTAFTMQIHLADSVPNFKAERISLTIGYDAELYYPQSVTVRDQNGFMQAIGRDLGYGEFTVEISGITASKLFSKAGVILEVESLALLSLPPSTPLKFLSFEATPAKEYELTTSDGSLRIINFCEPTAGYEYIFEPGFEIEIENPVDRSSGLLIFESGGEQMVEITLYNVSGMMIMNKSFTIGEGSITHAIKFGDVPSGAYFLRADNHEGTVRTKKIIIK